MDKKKLLIYGGVGAAALVGGYLLMKGSGNAQAASEAEDGAAYPAVLYAGGGYNTSGTPTITETSQASLIAQQLQGALDLGFGQLANQARAASEANATSLFGSLPAVLGAMGGGQVVGNYGVDGQGNTFFNLVTKLFNPSSGTATPSPDLPAPVVPPLMASLPSYTECPPGSWGAGGVCMGGVAGGNGGNFLNMYRSPEGGDGGGK